MDDEIKGPGNSLNYEFRMHDPRLGRFFAIDPLIKKYPSYTSYSFSGNRVIAFKELEGKEETPATTNLKPCGGPLDDLHPNIWINPQGDRGKVFIVTRDQSEKRSTDPAIMFYERTTKECLLGNTNFDFIYAGSIEHTLESLNLYMEKFALKSLDMVVYADHGNPESFRIKQSEYYNKEEGIMEGPVNYVSAQNIEGFGDDQNVTAAYKFMKLVSKVGDGGTLVLSICRIGANPNDEIVKSIMSYPETSNITLYVNADRCRLITSIISDSQTGEVTGYKSPFEQSTFSADIEFGWKKATKGSTDETTKCVTPVIENVGNITVNPSGQVVQH